MMSGKTLVYFTNQDYFILASQAYFLYEKNCAVECLTKMKALVKYIYKIFFIITDYPYIVVLSYDKFINFKYTTLKLIANPINCQYNHSNITN